MHVHVHLSNFSGQYFIYVITSFAQWWAAPCWHLLCLRVCVCGRGCRLYLCARLSVIISSVGVTRVHDLVHGSGDVSSSRDASAPPTTPSRCDWLAFSASPLSLITIRAPPLLSSSPPLVVINHSVNQIGSSDIFQTPMSTHLPSAASGGLRTDLLQPQMFLKWSWLHMCGVRKWFQRTVTQ